MSRNEIRLRRHRMTSSGADRFRNYGDVLQRHEQEMRIKRIVRVFTMFAVVLILVVLIFIVVRLEEKSNKTSHTGPDVINTHTPTADHRYPG